MHEASIALAIVEEVCERAEQERCRRVMCVRVQIGALTGVVPEALSFAWDLVTDGTLASGSELKIEVVPVTIYCEPCGAHQTITGVPLPVCPQCGTSSARIIRGRELLVSAMEVTDDASFGGRATEHSAQEYYAGR